MTTHVHRSGREQRSPLRGARRGHVAVGALAATLLAVPLMMSVPAADNLPDGRWVITLCKARPEGVLAAADDAEQEEGDTAPKNDSSKKSAPPPAGSNAKDVCITIERLGGAWLPLFWADGGKGLIEKADEDGTLPVLILFDAMGRNNNLFKGPGISSLLRFKLRPLLAENGAIGGEWKSPDGNTGKLTGELRPAPRMARPAPPLGEHPRFLLRKEDLTALKAKAATPFGQSLTKHLDKTSWSRSGMAVGLGVLYRITGDKTYAQRAQDLVLSDIKGGWWDVIGPIHDPPHKIMEAVYTWDLIHDACDPSFQQRLLSLLRANMRFMEDFCDIDRGNGHPHSNWSAQFQTGIGMAALGLLSEPTDHREPDPDASIPSLTPPPEPIPDTLPVFPYDSDATQITEWLAAGPFDIGLGADGLEAIGGVAKARVHNGLRFPIKVKAVESKEVNDKDGVHYIHQYNAKKFAWSHIKGDDGQPLTRGIEGTFRKFPQEWICSSNMYRGAPGYMDLRVASGYRSYRTFYLAAAWKVPEPVTVIVRFQNQQRDDPCVYIAGRKFRVNDMVRLEPGVYPVMHPVTYTTFLGSHGRNEAIYHGLNLQKAQPEQVQKLLNHRKVLREFVVRCRETLAGTPYADFWPRLWLASARAKMDAWSTHAVSEGGWNIAGDCYTLPSLQALAPFAHAYANAMGFALASPGHLGAVLPHQVHKTVFTPDRAFAPAFGRGGGPYGPMPYARCFSFVDEKLKPAVGWAAHRTLELALAGKLKSENLVVDELDPLSAAFALLNWPAPEQCRSPEGIVPLAAADCQRQCWTFRNRFKDGDDGVAAIAGFIHPGGDWPAAISGEFRLAALGNEWAVRGNLSASPCNIPVMADEVVQSLRLRSPVYREVSRKNPDGVTSVTLDLVSMLTKDEWRETYGKPVGSRTFFVDWSGACGAPVLAVVQDRIPRVPPKPVKTAADKIADDLKSGPPRSDGPVEEDLLPAFARKRIHTGPFPPPDETNAMHRWQFVTDATNKVTLRKDGFFIAAPNGATLNGTILSPTNVVMWQEYMAFNMEVNYRHDHRGNVTPRNVVFAGGDASYLVVLTVQRGQAPAATLSGDTIAVGPLKLRVLEHGIEAAR